MTILQFVLIAFVGIVIILAGFLLRQFDKKAGLHMIYPFDSGIGLMVAGAVLLIVLCVCALFSWA